MSEYGCIINTRTFAETSELYTEEMTKVFSGGLVYEYSNEGNDYGVVTIDGNDVSSVDDQMSDLKSALANATAPANGGGYWTDGAAQSCPDSRGDWDTSPFADSALPAMPTGAEKYLKNGAGDGPGFSGDGSQNAEGGSSSTASSGAGATSTSHGNGGSSTASSGSSTSSGAASTDYAPLVCCLT